MTFVETVLRLGFDVETWKDANMVRKPIMPREDSANLPRVGLTVAMAFDPGLPNTFGRLVIRLRGARTHAPLWRCG